VVSLSGVVVDVDDVLVELVELVDVVGRVDDVVVDGVRLATCCLGEVSLPAATSSRSTTIDTDAST
jgi:hypothetical protein